jgi:phosphoserine phosphatase
MLLKSNELFAGDTLTQTSPLETRVILVRHGESNFNAQGRHQGSSDESVLTEMGRIAARQTGIFLNGISFDAVYTSSLKRAQETTSEILKVMNLDIKVHSTPALREIDLQGWQGLLHREVQEKFPEEYRCWKQRPHEFRMAIPQTEALGGGVAMTTQQQYYFPVLALCDRAQQFWQEILPHHVGQTLLIVSHSGTIRALIATAMGLSPARYHALQQSNCGVSILNFPDNCHQNAQLEAMNLTTHLGESLPQLRGERQGLRLLLVPSKAEHPSQTQQLAQLLKQELIDFSISGTDEESGAIAQQILQSHPATVHLQVLREDFPELWQQTIRTRSSMTHSNQLVTGLVIASENNIKRLLCQALDLSLDSRNSLPLRPGTISAIHYPSTTRSPIIQAMNISGAVVTERSPNFING